MGTVRPGCAHDAAERCQAARTAPESDAPNVNMQAVCVRFIVGPNVLVTVKREEESAPIDSLEKLRRHRLKHKLIACH